MLLDSVDELSLILLSINLGIYKNVCAYVCLSLQCTVIRCLVQIYSRPGCELWLPGPVSEQCSVAVLGPGRGHSPPSVLL